ncbi:hypothetical protein SCHPADRAFT_946238 [Schizopora paradoxa]|uniref:BTB domain-containing protein n=1 Tax=Schizopora paradoxa TaxID=27342 RepID=A0A0H2R4J7_9AGAM|nr:hypothetical protein SCHPADRAFT_946238 [Schizopora paradoxa]
MAPRLKRPRLEDGSTYGELQEAALDEQVGLKQPKPHEKLWYDDGSIVLATDVHLYRVHKSILAQYSTVFKDMLDIPTGDGSRADEGGIVSAERWDGLPLVRMAGDSDEDVYHLLMALYNREYHQITKPTSLPIILALLNLSTKYDIPVIRREVIQHLAIYYPSESEKWVNVHETPLFGEIYDTPKDANFQLLISARRCNAGPILPMLFYSCAIESLDTIFNHLHQLDATDLKRIISGRELLLTTWIPLFGTRVLRPQQRCKSAACSDARIRMFAHWVESCESESRKFPLAACCGGLRGIGNEEEYKKLCTFCINESTDSLDFFESTFWDVLPFIFALDEWDELNKDI